MADLSDVENALVAAITAAVYPSGTGTAPSYGAQTRIYRGWPDARALDADLKNGIVNISVFSKRGMTRNTTRLPRNWHSNGPKPVPTITVTYTPTTVTFGGVAGTGNLCGVRYSGQTHAYAAPATATPAEVATALGAEIAGATVSGSTITLPTASYDTLGRVVGNGGSVIRETRRQLQEFLVTCWCNTPTQRDAVSSLVDGTLAPINWLPLADGTTGWFKYADTFVDDAPTKEALWRRDLFYTVEYGTTQVMTAAQMLFGSGITLTTQANGTNGVVTTSTVTLEPQ